MHAVPPPTPVAGVDAADIDLDGVRHAARLQDGSVAANVLWAALESIKPEPGNDHDQLELIAAWRLLESVAVARRLDAMANLARIPYAGSASLPREFVDDEIAVRVHASRPSVGRDLTTAVMLDNALPSTHGALSSGRIDAARASLIADAAARLTAVRGSAHELERRVLGRAIHQNPTALRQCLKRAVIALDPVGFDERQARAQQDRYVSGVPGDDGMADLHAHVTGLDWRTITTVLDAAARGAKTAGDARSMDQLRADALVAPFRKALSTGVLDGIEPLELARHRGRLPQIHLTVPATTLMGLGESPAVLDGYGPVSASVARLIAADGQWRRILTDPRSGAVLDVGTTTYTPPDSMARFVERRDASCRFPGCHRQAVGCDLDHTKPFPEGRTAASNLGALCRRHHRFKHEVPGTTLTQGADGVFTWRLPNGRHHTVEPPDLSDHDASTNDPLGGDLGPPGSG